MTTPLSLRCDGCGQSASPGHIARWLQRLEWTTRYRPVHVQGLLLDANCALGQNAAALHSPEGNYQGEAANLLESGLSVLTRLKT